MGRDEGHCEGETEGHRTGKEYSTERNKGRIEVGPIEPSKYREKASSSTHSTVS